jgi:ABC-2 type transport system ATP-binding protein
VSFGVDAVSVRFDDVLALDDVTVLAPPGAVGAIVGGDGSGKSTLLRTLAGLTETMAGTVRRPEPEHIGYLPAEAGSWPNLSVTENVEFVGGVYGLRGSALTGRAADLLARCGLAGVGDRLSSQLSGGMRTKLGFCLAMLGSPELLVLDEPTTGVDPVSRIDLWRLISETAANGTAVVMATTYMDEAERATSVTLLHSGRVLLQGSTNELLASVNGDIVECSQPEYLGNAWRNGALFHEWFPAGAPHGATVVDPSLEDVCIVAELALRSSETADGQSALT